MPVLSSRYRGKLEVRIRVCVILICASLVGFDFVSAQRTPPRLATFQEVLKGSEEVTLRWPVDVAAASSDTVAVADAYGPKLVVFSRSNRSWSVTDAVDLPAAPAGLAWDGTRFVTSVRRPGGLVACEPPEYALTSIDLSDEVIPGPIAATFDGEILVFDLTSSSVLKVAGTGEILSSTPASGVVTGLAAMPSGGFLLALGDEGRIEKIRPDGVVAASIDLPGQGPVPAWPAGLMTDAAGQMLVADRHNGRVLILDAQDTWVGILGRHGWDPGLFRYPNGLALLGSDLVLVADQGNGRAQIFQLIASTSTQ